MGPILVIGAVALVALAIIGFGVYSVVQGSRSWEDKVADIKGVVNYRAQKNPQIDDRSHKDGTLSYVTSPPVGGAHNATPQNCNGDVYDAPIANEHAVHSLEHGAVWVTYKQGLPADQVAVLAKKVQGKDYTFMSPYAGLDKNVSVQVWGYQLKVRRRERRRGSTSSSRTPGSSRPSSPASPAPAATPRPARSPRPPTARAWATASDDDLHRLGDGGRGRRPRGRPRTGPRPPHLALVIAALLVGTLLGLGIGLVHPASARPATTRWRPASCATWRSTTPRRSRCR
jgi:hypothetical protein